MKGEAESGGRGGLLASSPAEFVDCGDARLAPIPGVPYMERSPYSMTNKGIRMEHLLIPFPIDTNEKNLESPLTSPSRISGGRISIPEHQFLSLLHCKFEGKKGNVAIPIFQGWGFQPAERITDRLYHIEGKKEITKRTLYIKQHREKAQGNTQSISESADLFMKVSSPSGEEFDITHFWASWPSGILMRRPGGGFKLSDIPSPSTGSNATIGLAIPKLDCEFVVFLVWSKSPRAQVEPRDPLLYIDRMVPTLSAHSSSDRISKALPTGVVVSVAISPASTIEKMPIE